MTKRREELLKTAALAAVFMLVPHMLDAQVVITEVMYDLEGADSGREWVEVRNSGSEAVDLADWRFNDGSNHVLNPPPENGGTGSSVLPSGGFAILAADAGTFLSEHPGFSGTVIDTVMSLNNTAETITLIDPAGSIVDEASYRSEDGAAGDGTTLHRDGDGWTSGAETPGTAESGALPQAQGGSDASPGSTGGSVLRDPVVPSIAVDGGPDRTLVVGADASFRARSSGAQGEPLSGARVIWNFGDGTTKEGEQVFHHYRYPGRYVVHVSVSVGKFSALDRLIVTAEEADIAVVDANKQYIELENRSGRELDLSGWFLRADGRDFGFSEGALLLPGTAVRFPSTVTGLSGAARENTTLLYPNGTEAARYQEEAGPAVVALQETVAPVPLPATSQRGSAETTFLAPAGDEMPISTVTEESPQQAAVGAFSEEPGLWAWLLAVAGISGVGVIALILRRKEASEADEYTILE